MGRFGAGVWQTMAGGKRAVAWALGAAILTSAAPSAAGGSATREGSSTLTREEAFVVWNHHQKVQHTFLAARIRARSEGAYFAAFVADEAHPVTVADVVKGVVDRLGDLHPKARLTTADTAEARVVGAPMLPGACKNLGFSCEKAVNGWPSGERSALVLPFAAPLEGGAVTTPWAHLRQETSYPVLPFSDAPGEASRETATAIVDEDHPPRVELWVELGTESKTGVWERTLDTAVHGLDAPVAACYTKLLAKSPRLVGDVHAEVRLPKTGDGKPEVNGTRASSRPLEPVAKCLSEAITSAELPRLPDRAAPLQVHATLRPPVALPRSYRAVVLSSEDAEARLGEPESAKLPPELALTVSFEVTPAALRQSFDEDTRRALGLDLGERWRLLVLESPAEHHGTDREIAFRTLPYPTPAPGEAPLPVLALGDRPRAHSTPAVRWYKRLKVQRFSLALLVAAGVFLTIFLDERSSRRLSRRSALGAIDK
jgi:hypothetical protein